MTTTDKGQMKDIHICMSSEAYDQLTKADDELYFVPDECMTEEEADEKYAQLTDLSDYYTKTETDTALAGKQGTLTAGTGITITNNVISATGGGGGGGEQWIDLPITDITSHVFSVGDRIRFWFKTLWFKQVLAPTDWNTAPTFGSGLGGYRFYEMREVILENLNNSELFTLLVNPTPSRSNAVTLLQMDTTIQTNGKLAPIIHSYTIAFNAGGMIKNEETRSWSDTVYKVQYLPASTQ